MTNTTTEMLKTAHILNGQIVNATLALNKDWSQKNRMLNKAHKSLHDAIDTLILLAVAEGVGQENIASELEELAEEFSKKDNEQ